MNHLGGRLSRKMSGCSCKGLNHRLECSFSRTLRSISHFLQSLLYAVCTSTSFCLLIGHQAFLQIMVTAKQHPFGTYNEEEKRQHYSKSPSLRRSSKRKQHRLLGQGTSAVNSPRAGSLGVLLFHLYLSMHGPRAPFQTFCSPALRQ